MKDSLILQRKQLQDQLIISINSENVDSKLILKALELFDKHYSEYITNNDILLINTSTISELKEFFETFMDDSYDVGDVSTEDVHVTRLKKGFKLSTNWNDKTVIL